jgi:DNA processing protein
MTPSPVTSLRLTDRQRLSWLRLIRTENVGPATFRILVNRYGSAENALDHLPELAARGGARAPSRICTVDEAEAELEAAASLGASFIGIGEPDYPPIVRQMDQPPPLLAVKGRHEILALPAVSIVGSRNASTNGVTLARKLAFELSGHGLAVVSGMARGIDAAAHNGSIDAGTVAVLAGGLDRPYPPENLRLYEQIGERGVLVSEMPFGWEPRARDFPRRNRLIAGLGLGLLVVEAAFRSGSLISARLANEMGRIVFAIPGSPMDPRSEGTNALLKDGATIVTQASDIMDVLSPMIGYPINAAPTIAAPREDPPATQVSDPTGDRERSRLLEALGPTPVQVDELIRHTNLQPAQVLMLLLELDLAGRLERDTRGAVALVTNS